MCDSQRDLMNYFSRLNIQGYLVDGYVNVLEILNIFDEEALKEELNVRLLVCLGRSSVIYTSLNQRLCPAFTCKHLDSSDNSGLCTFEQTQGSLILESLQSIVVATETSRLVKQYFGRIHMK